MTMTTEVAVKVLRSMARAATAGEAVDRTANVMAALEAGADALEQVERFHTADIDAIQARLHAYDARLAGQTELRALVAELRAAREARDELKELGGEARRVARVLHTLLVSRGGQVPENLPHWIYED